MENIKTYLNKENHSIKVCLHPEIDISQMEKHILDFKALK